MSQDHWRLRGTLSGLVGLSLGALAATPASAQQLATVARLAAPEMDLGQERIAGRNKALLTQAFHPELVVKLRDTITVPTGVVLLGKPMGEQTLPAGTILTGSSARPGTFCTIARNGFGACLTDADGDGRLESVRPAACTNAAAEELLFTEAGSVCGAAFARDVRPISTPPTYAAADMTEAPSQALELKWTSDYDPRGSSKPVTISFDLSPASRDPDAQSLFVPGRTVELGPGGVGEVKVGGAVIQVLGFTPDRAVRYRVVRGLSPQSIRFMHRMAPEKITIYLP